MVIKKNIQNRKSKAISVSLNEYLITKGKVLVDEERFSSMSDVVATALTEFYTRLACNEAESEEIQVENFKEAVAAYLHSPEGHALIRSILRKSLTASDEEAAATSVIIEHQ